MKEILLTEKEMVFLVLLCIHAFYNQQAIYKKLYSICKNMLLELFYVFKKTHL